MKKILFTCWLLLIFLLPSSALAHIAGQPPFLRVNGQYANLYFVPLSSLYDFDLPQDGAPDNYFINQTISFELDPMKLPAPSDVIAKTKFDWDFADGTHSQGLKNDHKFTKIGSYIVKIYADDSTTPKPQIIESVLVNILPDSNYKLPKAKILVTGS